MRLEVNSMKVRRFTRADPLTVCVRLELRQGVELLRAAEAPKAGRRAGRFPKLLRLLHGFAREAVHFLGGRHRRHVLPGL